MSQTDVAPPYELGVDIGGTFTDLVLRDGATGLVIEGKLLTTPDDPARGAIEGVARLLDETGVPAGAIGRVVHGTTLVTNTLIERTGARTAYVTTAGFADVFETGRQKRYDMYDLQLRFPEPLVPRRLRFEVPERVDAAGRVRRALDPAAAAALARRLRDLGVEAVAVCFLHSYRAPEHERLMGEALRAAAPDLAVSLSAEVAPEIREYPRATTAAANAYVSRATRGYLRRFESGLRRLGCPGVLHITLSHGGLATRQTAERFPVRLVESGPAGGAMVAAFHAARLAAPAGGAGAGTGDALAFDMGGTTAKVCLLEGGVPRLTHHLEVARVHRLKRGSGLPLSVPCVDLIEIGAGGGSIVHLDRLGLLRVGPQSAGADPGPACYGRGGTAPTVTDADLVLGYLDPRHFLGGALPLDAGAAHEAFQRAIARPLGTDVLAAARATQLAVDEAMAGAARVHAAERGCDLRRVDLIAFGGAGPVHADRVARALKVRRVVIPYGAGTASGLGFLVAPVAFDFARSAPQVVDTLDPHAVAALCRRLADEGRALIVEAGLAPETVIEEWSADMRYAGQGYEIGVPCETPPWRLDAAGLRARFETVYRAAYGRVHPEAPVEVVTWRLRARGPRPEVEPRYETAGGARRLTASTATRLAYAPERGGMTPFAVYDRRELPPGASIVGPAIVEEQASTAVLGVGATATVDPRLNLIVTCAGGERASHDAESRTTPRAG